MCSIVTPKPVSDYTSFNIYTSNLDKIEIVLAHHVPDYMEYLGCRTIKHCCSASPRIDISKMRELGFPSLVSIPFERVKA